MPLLPYVEGSGDRGLYDKRSLYTELRMHNPAVVEAHGELHRRLLDAGPVDESLFEYVMVAVAQANECAYCASSHRENLVELEGVPEETVAAIKAGDYAALTEKQRTVVEFAETAAGDPHRVTEADIESLFDAGFDEAGVIQLLAVIGSCSTANMINTALDVDPRDRDEELATY